MQALLFQDSPRLLGEAFFYLREARELVASAGSAALMAADSPLVRFYRCIHAFKGMCGLMASRLPLAAELVPQFHSMEGKLAIRDQWSGAERWLPEFEEALGRIQSRILQAHQQKELERFSQSGNGPRVGLPQAVKASSGGRELVFPWTAVVQFIAGPVVAGRAVVPVGNRLVAVVPPSGKAHENVALGILVQTKSGQEIVVPVQSLEIQHSSAGVASEKNSSVGFLESAA
jgi:hypothetical protein